MGTTNLVDVVWVEIISMEILHPEMLPILLQHYASFLHFQHDAMSLWLFLKDQKDSAQEW